MQNPTAAQGESALLRNTLFAFMVSGAASQPLGSFIPFFRENYGLSYDVAGVLLSAQSVGNLLCVLLAGFMAAYVGRRRSVLFTSAWMAVAFAIFAAGLGHPAVLIAACFMTGVARGGNSNFCNTMVSTLTGPRAVRGYNLLHGSYAVGALMAPLALVAGATLWPANGWRAIAGALLLLCLSQILVYAKMPLPPENRARGLKNVDRGFLRNRRFWLGMAMLFCYIACEYSVTGWLVTYFQDIGVLSKNHSQMMNSLLWLVICLGRLGGALAVGKVSANKMLLGDGLGLCTFFMLMFFSRTPAPVILGLVGVGLSMATIYPMAFAFGSGSIKGNDLGCGVMIFGCSIGGVITPALVGVVAERGGIAAGMGLVAGSTVLLLAVIAVSILATRVSPNARADS